MIYTVNHATEDLQHRILILLIALPCQNGKGEEKRGKTQTVQGTVQNEERDKDRRVMAI